MDRQQLIDGVRTVQQGLAQVLAAIESTGDGQDPSVGDDPQAREQREIAVLRAFDRPPGQGLTQEEASRAFRDNGFDPRTMGGWATQGRLVTRSDRRRYLTPAARDWLRERDVDARPRGAGPVDSLTTSSAGTRI